MALPLPLPPSGILVIDPITGAMNTQWQNYFLQLNVAISSVSAAPNDARYVVTQPDAQLTNAINLAALTSGVLKIAVAAGTATISSETPIPVTDGGLGVATLAAHGVVVGNAALGVNVTGTGTTGQPLVSNGAAADPTYQTLPVGGGGTGKATLTANNVLLGNGTSAVQMVAPGAANNVLLSNGTTWTSAAAGGLSAMTLLHSGSGTDTSAAATVVDSFAIASTTLTAEDVLVTEFLLESTTQQTAQPVSLYMVTDSFSINDLAAGVNVAAGQIRFGRSVIGMRQGSTTNAYAYMVGQYSGNAILDIGQTSTFSTLWTGAWTLGLRHSGVTAGGTFSWRWKVYRMAGQ